MAPQRYTGVSRASRLVGLGRRAASGLMAATLAALAATAHADADPIVAERSATVLPGSDHSWGFAALAQDGRHVLLARRENGLTIWDAARREALPDIPGTEGANAAVAVPTADRLYVAAMDGSVIVIRASDRQVLKRVPVDSGNLNNALFDPASGQVLLTSGRRGAVSRVYRLDPACDCVRASLDLPAAKLDAPVLLGPGRIALPMRDEGRIAVIDLRRMALLQVWQPPQCARPSALAADAAGKRLFVACRGAMPRLLSLDAQSGAVLASAPAGRDIN
ncbi:YncE family protein, partial [Achromobacter deleyi]|uniref:YncE family protein n=1 Tax=Achromobacter deleyi TaxID=1353891 RepID=UPI001581EC53